jgi:transglutaminase-like putative cysteine protease
MPWVRIAHSTEYRYKKPVRFTTHRLMLRPRDSHDLRLLSATLGLYPRGGQTRWAHDVFGNSVCFLDWPAGESDTLRIVSTLELEHFPSTSDPHERIDPQAESYPFGYAAEEFPDLARTLERHYPDPERLIDAWARKFIRRSEPTRTMALLTAMTHAIKQDFAYERRDQEGTNPPLVTLADRRGACRDLALLMMEAARALGFAARFVSGYLYDDALAGGAGTMVGGGATHAWCSIYLPGAGWVEFDPTNGLVAGRNLVRVCVARTPAQAVPIAGGFVGSRQDRAGLTVDVAVTVGEPGGTLARAATGDGEAEPAQDTLEHAARRLP